MGWKKGEQEGKNLNEKVGVLKFALKRWITFLGRKKGVKVGQSLFKRSCGK